MSLDDEDSDAKEESEDVEDVEEELSLRCRDALDLTIGGFLLSCLSRVKSEASHLFESAKAGSPA